MAGAGPPRPTGRHRRAGLESEGVALARARRAVMKRLIEREPARALAVTVPADVRVRLPRGRRPLPVPCRGRQGARHEAGQAAGPPSCQARAQRVG